MSSRREFLLRLFALLDERAIPYVVLRNFDSVLDEGASDVDLLAADANPVYDAARQAAELLGLRMVQSARFINQTRVWWDGAGGFIRLDVDTHVRWRCFETVGTHGILKRRIRHREFWIPCPRDEVIVLRTNMISRNMTEERYNSRLVALGAQPIEHREARKALILAQLASPLSWPRIIRHLAVDCARLCSRLTKPVGISVKIASSVPFDESALITALRVLFPPAKHSSGSRAAMRRARFTGGIALDVVRVSEAARLPVALRGCRADFVMMLGPGSAVCAAHTKSGAMLSYETENPAQTIADFVCESLASSRDGRRRRGVSILLTGVDGAGKTTFARKLASRFQSVGFAACRYFHWIPSLRAAAQFPWPTFEDIPRKAAKCGLVASVLRLAKSVVLARISWHFCVQPLVRKGALVILDRFVTNYWLDPQSVRYGGPAWLLAVARWMFPKPGLLIALDAPGDVLAARKQELTREQIAAQQERLKSLPALAMHRMNLDAARSPSALAEEVLEFLRGRT